MATALQPLTDTFYTGLKLLERHKQGVIRWNVRSITRRRPISRNVDEIRAQHERWRNRCERANKGLQQREKRVRLFLDSLDHNSSEYGALSDLLTMQVFSNGVLNQVRLGVIEARDKVLDRTDRRIKHQFASVHNAVVRRPSLLYRAEVSA